MPPLSVESHVGSLTRALFTVKFIDGVAELTLTACHTYAVEAFTVRNLVRSLGKSYVNVDTDYSESDRGQLATRLGAFMEML